MENIMNSPVSVRTEPETDIKRINEKANKDSMWRMADAPQLKSLTVH